MIRSLVLLSFLGVAVCLPSERTGRIVGGQDASPSQFPYQASLRNLASDNIHFCMGIILNSRWVATTIRCSFWRMPVENILVVTGAFRLSSGGTSYRAIRVVEHPDYRQEGFKTYENDVSLLQVEGSFVFSAQVAPIALGSNFISGGVNVVIAGFGHTNDQVNALEDALQYFRSTTLTNADSQSRLPDFMDGEITERTLCTWMSTGQGVCRGITGAAVVANNEAIGIVSFGQIGGRCGVWPDCHTRISSFRSWILSVVG